MATEGADGRGSWKLAVLGVVATVYGTSLAMPVMKGPWGDGDLLLGYEALMVSSDLRDPFWPVFANLALLAGCIGYAVGQSTLALVAGIAGTALSVATLQLGNDPGELMVGFWLWVAAMVVLTLAAAFELLTEAKQRRRG
jgi:hypothetical protein